MKLNRIGATVALSTTLALALAGCAANEGGSGGGASPGSGASEGAELSGTLTGVGSSAMASAQETWVAQFQTTNPDVTVNYSPDGSGAGRDAFTGGGADFAGSDRALKVEELVPDALSKSRCADGSKAINLPVYISPIAVIYNLEGVDSLKLDAPTVAGIFKGQITKWNDAKIAAQNDGVSLPSTNITAVHRADDSGTTENFTDYLHTLAPEVWDTEPDGEWPYEGGEAAPQTSGVVDAVTNGTGTIGYADASKAGDLGVAEIKVGDTYLEYSRRPPAPWWMPPRLPRTPTAARTTWPSSSTARPKVTCTRSSCWPTRSPARSTRTRRSRPGSRPTCPTSARRTARRRRPTRSATRRCRPISPGGRGRSRLDLLTWSRRPRSSALARAGSAMI